MKHTEDKAEPDVIGVMELCLTHMDGSVSRGTYEVTATKWNEILDCAASEIMTPKELLEIGIEHSNQHIADQAARITELEAALSSQALDRRDAKLPAVLFDGYRVWSEMNDKNPLNQYSAIDVSNVLDAVVKLIKADAAIASSKEQK